LRGDDGFEDREGHQAPFTLQFKENSQRSAFNVQRRTKELEGVSLQKCLFDFFDRADDPIEIRPVAGVEFGMEQVSIDANFEGTAARRYERQRFDPLAEFENLGRQTDGLRRVVSNHAIFDRYFGFHPVLLSEENPTGGARNGQAAP
jgi:hypothetical protein